MTTNFQNRAYTLPIIVLMVAASILVSCNAHDKAVKYISNTVRDEVNQFNLDTDLKVCNPIQTLGKMIKSPSITEIIADKSELIATQ